MPTTALNANQASRRGQAAQVTAAIAHMEGHLAEPITLPEVCRTVGVGPRTLQKAFRAELGCTPMAWLRDRRLSVARDRLRVASASTTTVTEVASSLGITHLGRFAVEYRRRYGVPPSVTLATSAPQHS